MAANTKERILGVTAELFRQYGYTGTGLKQIVANANAPFGSLSQRQCWRSATLRLIGPFWLRASPTTWSMGGLAAGAIPEAVRSSHGYTPQLPSDARELPREPRPGDFFRN